MTVAVIFHIVFFVIGMAAFCCAHCHGFFNWNSFLQGFPIAAGLDAAYLWIRPDAWLSNKDANDNSVPRQADCLVAIFLLFLVAGAQALVLQADSKWMFVGTFFVGLAISNCVARLLSQILKRWHRK